MFIKYINIIGVNMLDKLLQISLEEIKNGYCFNNDTKTYTCHICGAGFETGEVFPFDGRFYEASKAVALHVEKEHGNMLEVLTSFDRKYTGITQNQKELIMMFYEGLSDGDIAKKTGVSPATVRHQRFVFKEKAKQAKLYLAIYEVLNETVSYKKRKDNGDDFISIHSGAKMIDDRYFITGSEEEEILASSFESLDPLKLKLFSPKEKKKIVILRKIASKFSKGVKYTEKEVNAVLKQIYYDSSTIRRYLIEYGFMERTSDCREYWIK
jgi:hypothetical protein